MKKNPLYLEESIFTKELSDNAESVRNKYTVAMADKYRPKAEDLTAFYHANKQDDLDWVILPVANFNAFYRSTTFEKNYPPAFPKNVFIRETLDGLCRFKVVL